MVGGGQADFAQNYADLNLMETISGWWGKGQTTIFPIIAWWYSPSEGKVTHERLGVISNVRRHNNQWVQHAMEEAIKFFASRMKKDNIKLTHLHIWTDGCGGQFKNKWQLLWLTTLLEAIRGRGEDRVGGHPPQLLRQ